MAGGSPVSVVVVAEVEAVIAAGVVAPVVVVVVVVVVRGVDEGVGLGGGVGDREREGDEASGGADGRGHVMSLRSSRQNSLILLYRYHCRWLERPDGGRIGGS